MTSGPAEEEEEPEQSLPTPPKSSAASELAFPACPSFPDESSALRSHECEHEHLLDDGGAEGVQTKREDPEEQEDRSSATDGLSHKGRILQGQPCNIALAVISVVSCALAISLTIMLKLSPNASGEGALGSGQYQSIKDGTCVDYGLFPILDKESCAAGAKYLGLEDTTVSVSRNNGISQGCFIRGGTSLWLSTESSASADVGSDVRKPICMTSGGLPQVVQGGSCSERGLITITARDVCEASAMELKIVDTTVTFTSNVGVPYGCYTKGGTQLWIGLKKPAEPQQNDKKHDENLRQREERNPVCMTKDGNPQRIRSGTFSCTDGGLRFITERRDCEDAAKKLGLPDTKVTFTSNLDVPYGCYVKGKELWMGIKKPDASLEIRRDPICMDEENEAARISVGSCAQNGLVMIYNPETCEAAARELKLEDMKASFTSDPKMPRGCYYKGDKELWLNTPSGTHRRLTQSEAQDQEYICGSKPPYLVRILA